jgi:hypothetical protein
MSDRSKDVVSMMMIIIVKLLTKHDNLSHLNDLLDMKFHRSFCCRDEVLLDEFSTMEYLVSMLTPCALVEAT